MQIDNELFNELKEGFDYLEEYDRTGVKPGKKVSVSFTIPISTKRKLTRIENKSEFVTRLLEENL